MVDLACGQTIFQQRQLLWFLLLDPALLPGYPGLSALHLPPGVGLMWAVYVAGIGLQLGAR